MFDNLGVSMMGEKKLKATKNVVKLSIDGGQNVLNDQFEALGNFDDDFTR